MKFDNLIPKISEAKECSLNKKDSMKVVCAHASAHYHYFAGLLAKLDMFYRK